MYSTKNLYLNKKNKKIKIDKIIIKNTQKFSVTTNIEYDFPKNLCQYLSQNLTRLFN